MMTNQDPNKVLVGVGGEAFNGMADKMASLEKAIHVARQVRAKLKELGWTNKMLAEAMGCSQPMVTKIVRGDQNLTLETISKLERVLGIKEIYLHKPEQPTETVSATQTKSVNGYGQRSPDIAIKHVPVGGYQNINKISYGVQQAFA